MSDHASESGHFYTRAGETAYEVPNKSKGGMRKTTLRDAKTLGLLPSPTTILQASAKPALTRWLQKTAILAALTTPRNEGENEDAFADRVLEVDAQSITDAAKERGTLIHAAIEKWYSGHGYDTELEPFVIPVISACIKFGKIVQCEKVVVGEGYAGKLDALFDDGEALTVVDFKTCSKLPKDQYEEHLLQLGCYAKPIKVANPKKIVRTCNIYIDSTNAGLIKCGVNEESEWMDAYDKGFVPLFKFWQWKNSYFL